MGLTTPLSCIRRFKYNTGPAAGPLLIDVVTYTCV